MNNNNNGTNCGACSGPSPRSLRIHCGKRLAQNKPLRRSLAYFYVLFSAFCFPALGQFSIDWYKVAGGGGTSTNGQYSVSGTIGQADAGHMSGGNYSLDGGFWGIIGTVQTPGAPALTVTRSGASVVVSWPSPSTGFVLQQNGSVNNALGWINYGGSISDNGTIKSSTISPPIGNLFFRLKK